ncbi:hypothetical protein HN832_01835 [archaeon]|jgi:hypothetical protein|nr:hypothetical protein [archaeon]MBT4373093.1 hypothetical protein [archaeon]MBT4531438.1 hypothetical protein [archaeon]MBT7001384.1 hypothetical protein [archaeon]MBT7282130.1 hypothetical protein [archaeon]
MFPKQHFLIGLVFSALFVTAFPQIGILGFLLILASSVLIDVDHYLYYVHEEKNWSLKNAFKWFVIKHKEYLQLPKTERSKHRKLFFFLHGIEPLILLFILGYFFHTWFYYILIGFAFHLFLDIVQIKKYQDSLYKLSVIYDWFRFKRD